MPPIPSLAAIVRRLPTRCVRSILAAALVGLSAPAAFAQTTEAIVSTFAREAIRRGEAPGVGVAVVVGSTAPRLFTYGDAVAADGSSPAQPFAADSIFEIASVTKVFTTNLLGQAVARGELSLTERLTRFRPQLGRLGPAMQRATLKQLGAFTAGLPSYAPLCAADPVPGCLPSSRPSLAAYGAADFAAFFRGTEPMDYNDDPPEPVASLPAPYFYSDYSLGLLGLLLAANDAPLKTKAVARWFALVQRDILGPLGMTDTFLEVPDALLPRRAGGYQVARATAAVAGNAVAGIDVAAGGAGYTDPPAVRIRGGGGRGAAAVATVTAGRVAAIAVTDGGRGYLPPAQIGFGGQPETAAEARIVVRDGKVVAVSVTAGGAGYAPKPTVTIAGGRTAAGRDAKLRAHVVNGRIAYVTVLNGGDGYVPPLAVVVAPGAARYNEVPIWAPAGALKTTLRDLAAFVRAAVMSLGSGGGVPAPLAAGFAIATEPYACIGPDPRLQACPRSSTRSGLAWGIQRAGGRVPAVVSKDGGLPGFATFVALMPEAGIGVAVMLNSETGANSGVAVTSLAHDILYAVFACRNAGRCRD